MVSRYALRRAVSHLPVGELTGFPDDVRDALPSGSLLDVLGIEPMQAGPGAARASMAIQEQHLNQSGVAQGGAIIALADAVAGWATYGLLEEGRIFTTLELKANLLRVARPGDRLIATASPIHAGRTTCVLDVNVVRSDTDHGQSWKPVARFSCTQLILEDSRS